MAGVQRRPAGRSTPLVDMGTRFRMLVSRSTCSARPSRFPAPGRPGRLGAQPSLKVGAAAWILAGGPHRTSFSQAISECLRTLLKWRARLVRIDAETTIAALKGPGTSCTTTSPRGFARMIVSRD